MKQNFNKTIAYFRNVGYNIKNAFETWAKLEKGCMKMIAIVKGLVLEKFTKEPNKDGDEARCFVRIYQSGEKENLDVNVKPKTYAAIKPGESVELQNIKIGVYQFNENAGMFAKEQ